MAAYGHAALALLLLLLAFQGCLATTDDLEAIKDSLQDTIEDTLQNSPLSDPATNSLLTRGLQAVVNGVGIFLMSALVAFGLYSLLTWDKSTTLYQHNNAFGHTAPAYDASGQGFAKTGYRTADQAYNQEQAYAVHQSIEQAAKKYQ